MKCRDVSEMTDGLAFSKLSGLIFMGKARCTVGDSTKSDLAAQQNVPSFLRLITACFGYTLSCT